MATGKASDFVIYNAEFQSGMVEKVTQFLEVFNEGTRGAIRLVPRALKGHYSKEAFFQDVSGLVTRRDITSLSAPGDLALTQDENISVKLNRKVGPVSQTLDAMKKAGMDEGAASRAFGELAGARKMKDMVNSAILAVETAISSVGLVTGTSSTDAGPDTLTDALALFGDQAQEIVCWVAHSSANFKILKGLIASDVTGLADVASIQGGVPAYLGRPCIVTDAPALWDANGSATDTYNTLGLVRGAVTVEESEPDSYITEIISGGEQLFRRFQAEYAYNVSVKGMQWDTTTGGINPTDGTLGTTTNWDKVAYDNRLTAGVKLVSK